MSRNKENVINVIASVASLAISTIISFFLSPYISRNLGVEANGYIEIANNFVLYALIIRMALNSMGSRFIMMSFYKNDYKKANIYYSSLFFADLIMSLGFVIVATIGILNLDVFIKISPQYTTDVKLLFTLLFLNFIQSTIATAWCTAPYIKNKLYLDSLAQAGSALLKGIVIFMCFIVLSPKMYYVGVGTLVSGIFITLYGVYFKFKLLPELRIKCTDFSFSALKELMSSGIWNSLSSLSNMLIGGFDIIIANIFVNPIAMGMLSVSKIIPSFIVTFVSNIANVFIPSFIIDYAENRIDKIKDYIIKISKIISVISAIPIVFLIVFGTDFYTLWQPTQDAKMLYILSTFSIALRLSYIGIQPLYNVFTIANKVKINSLAMVTNGVVSLLLTVVAVKYTPLGVYAVVGISELCCFIRNFVFVIPFSAKSLGLKWYTFFPIVGYSLFSGLIVLASAFLVKLIIPCNTWIMLILSCAIFSVIAMVVCTLVVLKKQEREILFDKIKSLVKKKD